MNAKGGNNILTFEAPGVKLEGFKNNAIERVIFTSQDPKLTTITSADAYSIVVSENNA